MIAIVDYDAGNVKSVEKALQYIGENPVVTRDREELLKADKVIVPGVGAFEVNEGKQKCRVCGCGGKWKKRRCI